MKEFSAQTGGRYTYVDDIVNLQELALAFASIFNGCDNFIISGCEISGTTISPGYVYINGKIRYFSGASGITTWPQYLYEVNRTETVAYASGSDKVGRNVYGCAIGSVVPTALDQLTGAVPTYIKIANTGGLRMNDALYGKYALLLKSAAGRQTVSDVVTFNNNVNVNGVLLTKGRASLTQGNSTCQMFYSGEDLVIQSTIESGTTYSFRISSTKGFQFYVNNTLIYTIGVNSAGESLPVSTNELNAGNIVVSGSNIINKGHASNSAVININVNGYNGGTDYYRDTNIGNGKGNVIVAITGSTGLMQVNGKVAVNSSSSEALTIHGGASKNNVALCKIINWRDSSNEQIAYIGYGSTTNNIFEIRNTIANISIKGLEAVDLGPAIKENGQLLSEKYATATRLTEALALKANSSAVYTKEQANSTFATKAGGLSQFVTTTNTKAALRQQIEAVSASDVAKVHPRLVSYLADMATSEFAKVQICKNIGAARVGDYQAKLSDSGWVYVASGLYARQIGNVVCIQGTVKTIHSGTVFTLPNSIDAPKYDAAFSTATDYNSPWTCKIAAGQKQCKMIYCNGACGKTISFSMTYMV